MTSKVLACVLSVRNVLLRRIFRFNKWHVLGTYFDRPYKRKVVEIAISAKPTIVVEVGTGLGEILKRVKSQQRFGFDVDSGAVAAAKFLDGRKTAYAYGSLIDGTHIEDRLLQADVHRVDVLIMVNWIHELTVEQIMLGVSRICKVIPVKCLLMDAIKPGIPGYKHHHSHEAFSRYGRLLHTADGDQVRSLHLLELRPDLVSVVTSQKHSECKTNPAISSCL